jgi:Na+/proline symporter
VSTVDLIIVIIYLLAIVIVGLLVQKKASQGINSYFLGNRKLPWWVLGARNGKIT